MCQKKEKKMKRGETGFFFLKTKDLKIDMWENNESFKELRSPSLNIHYECQVEPFSSRAL